MNAAPMTPLVDLLKVLAHPMRLRILALLRDGELCVCQIVDVLGVATSTISEHLAALRKAGLLVERRDGRWVHYGLSPKPELVDLLQALWPHVDAVGQVAQDSKAVKVTRGIPVEVTCSKSKPCASPADKGPRHGK